MNIVGYYNEHGYRVVGIRRKEIRELYTAGNHRQDSQVTVSPGAPDALPLRQIKKSCARTACEIAGERDAKFIGVEYEDPEASWLTRDSPSSQFEAGCDNREFVRRQVGGNHGTMGVEKLISRHIPTDRAEGHYTCCLHTDPLKSFLELSATLGRRIGLNSQ